MLGEIVYITWWSVYLKGIETWLEQENLPTQSSPPATLLLNKGYDCWALTSSGDYEVYK